MTVARPPFPCEHSSVVKTPILVLALLALVNPLCTARADEPLASEWQADCRPYLAVLAGQEGSDLDITYCTGLTRGILAGLGTGAGIGAVSMASALTVIAGLPEDEVRKIIDSMDRRDLLGICAPGDLPVADVVQTVSDYLDGNPDSGGLPVTAAFFEALQTRYPCMAAPAPPADGDGQ